MGGGSAARSPCPGCVRSGTISLTAVSRIDPRIPAARTALS